MGQKMFRRIFKSITADNGSEFLDIEAIEASVFGTQRRTHIYFRLGHLSGALIGSVIMILQIGCHFPY
jgi:hypothetical protein